MEPGKWNLYVKTVDNAGNEKETVSGTITIVQRVTGMTMSGPATIKVGSTEYCSVSITPSNADNKSVTWSSSNTGIATVDSSGRVTGKATGTVTITATAKDGSGIKASKNITIEVNKEFNVVGNGIISGGNLVFAYSSSGYTGGTIRILSGSYSCIAAYSSGGGNPMHCGNNGISCSGSTVWKRENYSYGTGSSVSISNTSGNISIPIPSSTLSSSYELSGSSYTSGCSSKSFTLEVTINGCLLYTSPSPRDPKTSRMPSSA